MTDFYREKKKSLELVDGLIGSGICSRSEICLAIERNTGFSAKMVNRYIDQLILSGSVKENENGKLVNII